MDKEREVVDWNWVSDQLNTIGEILEKIGGLDKVNRVAGIPRGGLIPAVMISHAFGIPYISYSSAKGLSKYDRKKTLVIDDICDSGVTLLEAERYDFVTAALVTRKGSKTTPNMSGYIANHDKWFIFPWESIGSKTIQDYLVESNK